MEPHKWGTTVPAYNFKRDSKVYLVDELNNQYNIDVSTITFSQTFMEKSFEAKTIQSQDFFDNSVINKANPANFTFTFPALREDDFTIVFDKALSAGSFDLYIETTDEVFKLENCVITNGRFVIEKLRPLSMEITGEASKLSTPGVLSGTPIIRDSNRTYNRITNVAVFLDGAVLGLDFINSININLINQIKWTPYLTLQDICEANVTQEPLYPQTYVIESKELSGTILCFLTNENDSSLQSWNNSIPILIQVGQDISGTTYGFEFDMNECFYKQLINASGEVYAITHSWKLVENPTVLSDLLTYVTL